MDIHEIKNYLPHRYPFLMVDRVLSLEPNQYIKTLKNVSAGEPFFSGHFPCRAVMPGVLIVEGLAQTAAIMAASSAASLNLEKRVYYFTGINKARFKRPVEPGDQLHYEVKLVRQIKNMWNCRGEARVEQQLVASVDGLMFTFKDL